ncbi:MAG TPA: alpha-hydroxy acid oxidase, partial [Phenylobacterium sp.]|nr:alpha-hydroxy acid oxidase [Phenylobacterium sp.]
MRALAKRRLPRPVFDFMDGAADEEVTLRRNREDLDATQLAPRVMRDVSRRDLRTEVLGTSVDLPLIIGPTGLAALGWPRADAALARAAAAFNVPFVISTSSSVRLEEIAEAAPGARLWFQVYIYKDRELVGSLIRRARACGVEALVLTVDTPVLGWRRRDHRNGFTVPLRPSLGLAFELARHPGWSLQIARHGVPRMQNFVEAGKGSSVASLAHLMTSNMDASVTWDDLRWLRDQWSGPLVIKGLLSAEDAKMAVAAGIEAVLV